AATTDSNRRDEDIKRDRNEVGAVHDLNIQIEPAPVGKPKRSQPALRFGGPGAARPTRGLSPTEPGIPTSPASYPRRPARAAGGRAVRQPCSGSTFAPTHARDSRKCRETKRADAGPGPAAITNHPDRGPPPRR